jgi:hypothetical protein
LREAAAVAVLGHVALLGYLGTRPPKPAPQGSVRAMEFTAYVRPATPASSREASVPGPAVREEAPAQPAAASESPAPAGAAAEPPRGGPPAGAPAPEPEQPYLPRGELTVPPKVLGPIDVRFPEDVEGLVHLDVKLTLFIDEEGRVQRIRIDSPGIHPSFERAVRETFAAARFAPGELHQRPVRSQMRLEVSFDAPGRSPVQAPSAGSRRSPS